MPRIKRHIQKNDEWQARVVLKLLPQTRLMVTKLHDSDEVLLEVDTMQFVKGLYFATSVETRIALTKAEAQELFAALGYCLRSKPPTPKPASSRRPKRRG